MRKVSWGEQLCSYGAGLEGVGTHWHGSMAGPWLLAALLKSDGTTRTARTSLESGDSDSRADQQISTRAKGTLEKGLQGAQLPTPGSGVGTPRLTGTCSCSSVVTPAAHPVGWQSPRWACQRFRGICA